MAPTQSSGGPPDKAAAIASARESAAEQRRRAARAAAIVATCEEVHVGEPELVGLARTRVAALHRRVQTRHLTAAALFDLYAERMAASLGGARGQDFRPAFMSAVAAAIGVGSATATMHGQSPAAVVATASDAVARAAHDLEVALGEGPAITAMTEGVPVSAVGGSLPGRWPLYGPAVGELGVRAVIAVPLRSASTGLGALCGYSREPVLSDGALTNARQVAEAVASTMLLAPGHPAPDVGLPGLVLFGESDYQAVVHQAAGMVSAQCDCGIDEAEDLLRARAFADGQPVEQVARAVLRRETRLDLSLAGL